MKRFIAFLALIVSGVAFGAPQGAGPLALSSRILPDGSVSLLAHVRQLAGPADEIRVELPGHNSQTAVLMSGPAGWKLERDGRWVKMIGPEAAAPLRLRVALFDVKEQKDLARLRVRVRAKERDLFDQNVESATLPRFEPSGTSAGFLEFPTIVTPGEAIEITVLDPSRTPPEGQWLIAGVAATPVAENRLRVQLPTDLPAGSPLRVSYFDVWGERVIDALSVEENVVSEAPSATVAAARITGCVPFAFIGRSACVCGDFPESARNSIRIDGQPAKVVAASRSVLHLYLPDSLMAGPHTVTGDPGAGFPASEKASFTAVRLQGSIDTNALLRGQSTTMRLGIEGVTDPMKLVVTNRSPGVVSIPGGNHQEVATSGGARNGAELRVNATGRGNFQINYALDLPRCPCQDAAQKESVSTASRPAPIVVPRRVLATLAAGATAATYATAQAVALVNGLSVVEVVPLPSLNAAMVVFEIQDGLDAFAKAAALAADPRVTLSQTDFVYDTSQGKTTPPHLTYGVQMIGADVVQSVSRGDGIRVAVIDAGVDTGHEALAKKVAEHADVTGTGWTPDAHGTLVAGVIASDGSGNTSSSGVAPGVQLVAIKSCVALSARQAAARCWSSTLVKGLDMAMRKNVRIANLSVGGPEDKLLSRMVDTAVGKGIAVVSAAGNDGPGGKPSYPAAFENVIAVTAVDAASHLYAQATRGSFVDVAAPGVDVISTGPGGRTRLFSGTSAATAFASGAAALLLQQRPGLSQAELSKILRETAKDLGASGPDAEFGYGLLDVCRALGRVSNKRVTCR